MTSVLPVAGTVTPSPLASQSSSRSTDGFAHSMIGGNEASPTPDSTPASTDPPPLPPSTAPPAPDAPPAPPPPVPERSPPAPDAPDVPVVPPPVSVPPVVVLAAPPLPEEPLDAAVELPVLEAPPLPPDCDPVDAGRSAPMSEHATARAHPTRSPITEIPRFVARFSAHPPGWYDVAMANLRDVGGTRGGIGTFLIGLSMAAAGGYLLLNQVQVHGGYFTFGGMPYGTSFGLSLVPILAGVFLLFVNGKSVAGWILTVGGGVVVLAGILMSLQIHFQPTSLYNTLVILVLLFGGLGLIFRSLRAAA
jgi:hypothetical protein